MSPVSMLSFYERECARFDWWFFKDGKLHTIAYIWTSGTRKAVNYRLCLWYRLIPLKTIDSFGSVSSYLFHPYLIFSVVLTRTSDAIIFRSRREILIAWTELRLWTGILLIVSNYVGSIPMRYIFWNFCKEVFQWVFLNS